MASPFSGKAGRMAAIWQATQLEQAQKEMDRRIAEGQTAAIGAIDAGQPLSLEALSGGYDAARGSYGDAIKYFSPYAETGLKAFNQYADATGVNGQAGYDNAVGNFRASPGYQYQVDQATDAVARKASSLGALGSGNTMTAITDRASNLADQEYSDYLGRLNGIGQVGYNAASNQAGLTKGIGDLHSAEGIAKAGVYDSNAKARAGIFGNSTALGVNTFGNTTAGINQAGLGGMLAGQTAAQNRFSAGMGLAQLAAQGIGAIAGMPTGGGSAGGAPGGNFLQSLFKF